MIHVPFESIVLCFLDYLSLSDVFYRFITFILIMLVNQCSLQSSDTRSHPSQWLCSCNCSALNHIKHRWKQWGLLDSFDSNKRTKARSMINSENPGIASGVSEIWKYYHSIGPADRTSWSYLLAINLKDLVVMCDMYIGPRRDVKLNIWRP